MDLLNVGLKVGWVYVLGHFFLFLYFIVLPAPCIALGSLPYSSLMPWANLIHCNVVMTLLVRHSFLCDFINLNCQYEQKTTPPPPQVFAVSFVLSCYVNHLFNYAHRSPNNFFLIWLLDLKIPVCHYTLEMVTTLELVIPCQCQCLISNFSYFCNIFVL